MSNDPLGDSIATTNVLVDKQKGDGTSEPYGHEFLDQLSALLANRLPENGGELDTSYVSQLFAKGPDAFLKKIGEESAELIMACKDGQNDKIVYETADLWFHTLVALAFYGINAHQIIMELARRYGVSGLVEKASRTEN